ncbi:MAG: hypothetical protein GX575_13745 [Candidatus Anammoximicrobium sp.]|nr:hypothetical protein [Candidatus Anammoximicrobium sp.]
MSRQKPQPPDHLDADARAKWLETLPTLANCEPTTLDLLTSYAAAWSRMVQAERKVAELGVVVRASGGTASISPFLTVAQQERRAVRQLAETLRLTPAARAKGQRQQAKTALQILTSKGRTG